jgi:hypothetical protein
LLRHETIAIPLENSSPIASRTGVLAEPLSCPPV